MINVLMRMRNVVVNGLSIMNLFGIYLLCFWICCVSILGEETDIVTNKTLRRGKDNNGIPELQIETHRRGPEKVFVQIRKVRSRGVMSITSSYYVKGKLVCIEEDKNGDGVFETMVVFGADHHQFEVFVRNTNNAVAVAPSSIKRSYEAIFNTIEGFWDDVNDSQNEDSNYNKSLNKD